MSSHHSERKSLAGVDDVLPKSVQEEIEVAVQTPELDKVEEEIEAEMAEKAKSSPDGVYRRFEGEEEIPSYTVFNFLGDKSMLFFKVLFALLAVGYTIAALTLDFQRGKPILFIEITFFIFWLIGKAMKFFRPQLESLQRSVKNMPKGAAIAGQLILLVIALGLAVAFSKEDFTRLYGLLGLIAIILICYAFSWDRKNVNWRPVIWGFAIQYVFALFILRTQAGENMFKFFGDQIQALLGYTNEGVNFVFEPLLSAPQQVPGFEFRVAFALSVLPVIIFFSGITSVLFYFGILQSFTLAVGNIMVYTMGTSAPESLSAAGNIFLGQTESPLLIRPYLKYMTNSELHAIMTGGFATIAGGVLAAYISFGIPANHLLSASVMSAPAALAISKLVYPETVDIDDSAIDKLDIGEASTNSLEAFTRGATLSIGLIANIIVNLIAFLALIAFLNEVTHYLLEKVNVPDVNFTNIVGYIFSPFALLMGIQADDMKIAGELLGIKIIANEFVAFTELTASDLPKDGKTFIILTYAIAGFSNFSSIGIQLGGLGIMAPTKLTQLSKMALSSMFCGNIACFMTACIAGVLLE